MKNTFLATSFCFLGLTTTFISCSREDSFTNLEKINNEEKPLSQNRILEQEDLSSEMLKYTETITLTDKHNNIAKILATSNNKAVIDEYKDDALTFEIIDKDNLDIPPTDIKSKEESIDIIPSNEQAFIKFYVIEKPVIENTQLLCFKSGSRFKIKESDRYPNFTETWSDLGKNAKIEWYSTPNGQGIEVETKSKDCGWCGKYVIGTTALYSTNPTVQYYNVDAKRMYVQVKSTDRNRRVSIW